MDERIALVLPAFNEEASVMRSLDHVLHGLMHFPQWNHLIFTVDDGSSDMTTEAIYAWAYQRGVHAVDMTADLYDARHDIVLAHHRNPQNRGLVQTLKDAYARALYFTDISYVLKTDLDADFNQEIVLRQMLPLIKRSVPLAAGIRWRKFCEQEHPYEHLRRSDIIAVMAEHLDPKLCLLDPPSAGSQLYSAQTLDSLLEHEMVRSYNRRWGLDFLMPVVASHSSVPIKVINIEDGRYDPRRRPAEKVRMQYDAYIDIISQCTGKSPREISARYGMEDA